MIIQVMVIDKAQFYFIFFSSFFFCAPNTATLEHLTKQLSNFGCLPWKSVCKPCLCFEAQDSDLAMVFHNPCAIREEMIIFFPQYSFFSAPGSLRRELVRTCWSVNQFYPQSKPSLMYLSSTSFPCCHTSAEDLKSVWVCWSSEYLSVSNEMHYKFSLKARKEPLSRLERNGAVLAVMGITIW